MPYTYKYPRPAVTVDIIVFTDEEVLLIQRKYKPFQNHWALPGGFLDLDETPEQAALRELKEETDLELHHLTQFKTFGALDRDPRHRTISIAYYAFFNGQKSEIKAADDAANAQWSAWNELPELAFDHKEILNEFINDKRFHD